MDLQELEGRMQKSIDVFNQNLSEIRAGRANPAILNKISVEYYGMPTPINQVAGISVPEARTIVIQPWDASVLKAIEKAIPKGNIRLIALPSTIKFYEKLGYAVEHKLGAMIKKR